MIVDGVISFYKESSPEILQWINYIPFSVASGIFTYKIIFYIFRIVNIIMPEDVHAAFALPLALYVYISASYELAPRAKKFFLRLSMFFGVIFLVFHIAQYYEIVLKRKSPFLNTENTCVVIGCYFAFISMYCAYKRKRSLLLQVEAPVN